MKKNVLFFLSIFISVLSYGIGHSNFNMATKGNSLPVFEAVEKGHTYVSINDYMAKFVKYPEGTESFGLMGTSVVEFVVTATGKLTDFRVINSISNDIDQEMIGVLQGTSGNWNPGFTNGKPVDMKREVSVVFKPNKNYNLNDIARKSQIKGDEKLLVEKDPKKAIKYYSRAISLLPYEESFLAIRGLCKYELGDEKGARKDWDRIIYLNNYNSAVFHFKAVHLNPAMKNLKGFAKLSELLN